MEIRYTLHSEEQITERKIEKVWVEETTRYPDKISVIGKKHYAIRKINGGVLKVVYVKEKYIKIITVYWA